MGPPETGLFFTDWCLVLVAGQMVLRTDLMDTHLYVFNR